MKNNTRILCTLGTKTINKKFLKFLNNKVSLVRINLSHVKIKDLKRNIILIKRYCSVPICIDTEGAQIRTKIKTKTKYEKKDLGYIFEKGNNFNLYPDNVFKLIKKNDILEIGFDNLKIKIIKKLNNKIIFKTIESGNLENNKGVHLVKRKIKLDYLTKKDFEAIKIAKSLKIKNFALSFTSSYKEIKKFNLLLPNQNKIFKIETKTALKNLKSMFKHGIYFLIDRGDLSKDVSIEKIPVVQRYIFNTAKKFKKIKIYIATNYLESMIDKPYPTRAEANDIYNSLEMGANGIVLAAETAIGKFPEESVNFLRSMIKTYQNNKSAA